MRYVVLRISDDQYAEQLAEDLHGTLEKDAIGLHHPVDVIGMFKAPTLFCDPTDGHRGKKTQSGWTKGKKYGWWVCAKCKKPSKGWGKSFQAVISSGVNMLKKEQS